jgi:hypothetical protein
LMKMNSQEGVDSVIPYKINGIYGKDWV